ncbi:F-box domain-containing protein [Colletotrichum orchidophilum]|uniref:F-box domain-containing protein n=1 Tax=Colletotrichum orchidophilum TaxID=1209926 RepID=A0A1G4B7Y0_9PEZI|nr:F-box domain-containing protein [Colletotrichum orchidophilum]OHE97375.1 F-box domain-containing protein [Colletotrichum orchidophilum]
MPRKRRRIRRQSAMDSDPSKLTWPPAMVPVEIFDEITTYLARSDVKTLRLVNREFDKMVSSKYFRNVVVPFRSEMYKARKQKIPCLEEEDDGVQRQLGKDTLFSSGMRIFQSFGEHILRFALSLELDEESLAYPPIKPTQKAVTSYWGIYRWPHESYLRYTELEGLEQTADETASMKEALRCLVKVQELGLCCDAGLGYLLGPDQQLESPPLPHPVFGLRNLRYRTLQRRLARADSDTMNARKLAFESPREFKYTVLESMVRNAGYTQEQAKDAIAMLLSTENVSLMNIDFDERTAAAAAAASHAASIAAANANLIANANNNNDTVFANVITDDQEDNLAQARAAVAVLHEITAGHALQPRNLTRAQKEMLLELEWAHRALIQSYVLALIDNARMNSFSSLTTLTIAKIPSSHVYMLQRADFWQSLPNLTNVALAVVADWRQVSKVAPGCVEDNPVSPVDAVARVHRLLRDHIATQPNIKFLHFEWVCGGEFAPGITQRNQYVLPAPFCLPAQMVQPGVAKLPDAVLALPHVKHLSLKNCYSAPHIFLQVLRTMAMQSLDKLELESISLTGAPTRNPNVENAFGPALIVGPVHGPGLVLPFAQGQPQALQQIAHLHAHQNQPPPLPPAPLQTQANPGFGFIPALAAGAAVAPPPPPAPGNMPINMAVNHMAGMMQQGLPQIANVANHAVPPPPPPDPFSGWGRMRLRQPRLLSWAGIVERLAPAPAIREILAGQGDEDDEDDWVDEFVRKDEGFSLMPRPHSLVREKTSFGIEHMSLKSCGYAVLDVATIDNHSILPVNSPWQEPSEVTSRRRELAPFMQTCNDRLTAKITNYLSNQEHFNLTTAFGMDTEWTGVYDEEVIEAAKRDGIVHPGKGRFTGMITKAAKQV